MNKNAFLNRSAITLQAPIASPSRVHEFLLCKTQENIDIDIYICIYIYMLFSFLITKSLIERWKVTNIIHE